MKTRATLPISAVFLLLCISGICSQDYLVQRGDTIFNISRRFDVDADYLMKINNMSDASQLRAGQKLIIPSTYEVQPRDTYYSIARKLGIPLAELLTLNNRTQDSLLLAGETLLIPSKSGAAPAPAPAQLADRGSAPGQGSGSSPASGAPAGSQNPAGPVPPGQSPGCFWPHGGERAPLSGKLTGTQFNGQQGDAIVSVSSGKVIWVAPYRGYNKLIIVEAPDNHLYAYGGNDITLVSVGDAVIPGMEIGKLGINPHEGMAKAFFFVYKNGNPVDPEKAPRV